MFFLRNRKHLHTQLRLGIQLTIKNKIAEYISYIILHLYLQALRRQCLSKIYKKKFLRGERVRLEVHQTLFISYVIKCQK